MKTHTKDYYEILGLPEQASTEQIKKTYRALALEHHPDRNPGNPESEERFKDITEAYGVLMDPRKRNEYDRFRQFQSTGQQGGPQFQYSQQEIFENMFRQTFGRDIFNDLNTDFKQSGFRSGHDFFGTMFFGAAGGITKFMGMIPGPIGKIGKGLWLLQSIGSSLYAYKKMQESRKQGAPIRDRNQGPSSLKGSIKSLFTGPSRSVAGNEGLDISYQISISPQEARTGTFKNLAYKAGEESEHIKVSIPPAITSGKKLRLKGKGLKHQDQRGDLILTIHVKPDN
ncbi:MAG: DnaJ domain-containing protein [Nitrospinaceae bacterium]|nr:J domain-containing protein [Nitrospinaceae bacterium]NIR57467.1 J domain-containing protein [Nitrospinaceae bacterium]NIS87934.1 J domain-containing protein [Nitrospinaceae bacterium]NIT84802.1 J domain-containing protein [Nitrospinaceae bacterium]NIU46978.1 J domain-containing protein [Nitrospinaceae bacterium]